MSESEIDIFVATIKASLVGLEGPEVQAAHDALATWIARQTPENRERVIAAAERAIDMGKEVDGE